eukprot:GCRY01000838.1.p1 GENE.GCRY01000838.1~~GCRY01000838.1.p1  ORF type:complete len:278 (+),score=70.18 GCRY01000838.1:202-1035(+)
MSKTAHTILHDFRAALTPLPKTSDCKTTGKITPEEFVRTGDFLASKCPTWEWEKGNSGEKSYLPPEKQFLIFRNVPCVRRVGDIEGFFSEADESDEHWVVTKVNQESSNEEVLQIENEEEVRLPSDDDEDLPDIEDLEEEELLVEDPGTVANTSLELLATRTYDLTLAYDRLYQTPCLFIIGYDEKGNPLTPQEMMQDISQDHAKKTATVEPHPHLSGVSCVKIHPCQHAHTISKLIMQMSAEREEFIVEQYLLLFIKIIGTAIPAIECDQTQSFSL